MAEQASPRPSEVLKELRRLSDTLASTVELVEKLALRNGSLEKRVSLLEKSGAAQK